MGKTKGLFKKTGDIKGPFLAKMSMIKDRNSKILAEAEEMRKRWQEYLQWHCELHCFFYRHWVFQVGLSLFLRIRLTVEACPTGQHGRDLWPLQWQKSSFHSCKSLPADKALQLYFYFVSKVCSELLFYTRPDTFYLKSSVYVKK